MIVHHSGLMRISIYFVTQHVFACIVTSAGYINDGISYLGTFSLPTQDVSHFWYPTHCSCNINGVHTLCLIFL